VIANDR